MASIAEMPFARPPPGYRLRSASDAPQSLLSRELHRDCEYCRALVYPCSQILYVTPLNDILSDMIEAVQLDTGVRKTCNAATAEYGAA